MCIRDRMHQGQSLPGSQAYFMQNQLATTAHGQTSNTANMLNNGTHTNMMALNSNNNAAAAPSAGCNPYYQGNLSGINPNYGMSDPLLPSLFERERGFLEKSGNDLSTYRLSNQQQLANYMKMQGFEHQYNNNNSNNLANVNNANNLMGHQSLMGNQMNSINVNNQFTNQMNNQFTNAVNANPYANPTSGTNQYGNLNTTNQFNPQMNANQYNNNNQYMQMSNFAMNRQQNLPPTQGMQMIPTYGNQPIYYTNLNPSGNNQSHHPASHTSQGQGQSHVQSQAQIPTQVHGQVSTQAQTPAAQTQTHAQPGQTSQSTQSQAQPAKGQNQRYDSSNPKMYHQAQAGKAGQAGVPSSHYIIFNQNQVINQNVFTFNPNPLPSADFSPSFSPHTQSQTSQTGQTQPQPQGQSQPQSQSHQTQSTQKEVSQLQHPQRFPNSQNNNSSNMIPTNPVTAQYNTAPTHMMQPTAYNTAQLQQSLPQNSQPNSLYMMPPTASTATGVTNNMSNNNTNTNSNPYMNANDLHYSNSQSQLNNYTAYQQAMGMKPLQQSQNPYMSNTTNAYQFPNYNTTSNSMNQNSLSSYNNMYQTPSMSMTNYGANSQASDFQNAYRGYSNTQQPIMKRDQYVIGNNHNSSIQNNRISNAASNTSMNNGNLNNSTATNSNLSNILPPASFDVTEPYNTNPYTNHYQAIKNSMNNAGLLPQSLSGAMNNSAYMNNSLNSNAYSMNATNGGMNNSLNTVMNSNNNTMNNSGAYLLGNMGNSAASLSVGDSLGGMKGGIDENFTLIPNNGFNLGRDTFELDLPLLGGGLSPRGNNKNLGLDNFMSMQDVDFRFDDKDDFGLPPFSNQFEQSLYKTTPQNLVQHILKNVSQQRRQLSSFS
eukprot:TRINITY_DN9144_c0_g1_i2.p1 TRINITY_DN9144_c0_g1~~TRINITY_DN9144_c0_g1_i2.p1  ORF type:complete len:904 (-),score=158.57 TRINITY_DN9144_c0_g1_i2:86-2713(-)